jgi:hypothetical protein
MILLILPFIPNDEIALASAKSIQLSVYQFGIKFTSPLSAVSTDLIVFARHLSKAFFHMFEREALS